MTLLVISVGFNRPSYLPYQYELLKKFMTQPFSYMFFDNSVTESITTKFINTCKYLNISYTRIPQNIHTSHGISDRAGKSLDYAIQHIYNVMQFRGIVMINDSDLFLLKPFDPITKLGTKPIIGRSHKNVYYLNHPEQTEICKLNYYTNQYVILNFDILPNIQDLSFMPGIVEGVNVDCGGKIHTYLKNNGIEYCPVTDIPHSGVTKYTIDDICDDIVKPYFNKELETHEKSVSEIFDDSFLHLRMGSNWNNDTEIHHEYREDNLFTFLCRRLINWDSAIKPSEESKYVISFSLYGNNPKYTYNAIMNAKIAEKIYHGWIVRIYYDNTVSSTIIKTLSSFSNTECIEKTNTTHGPGHERMLWRFHAASDSSVSAMISRDCDSWLSFREAIAVKEWLNSDKGFHIIRDHCYHSQKIMGGIWGIKKGVVPLMKQLCDEYIIKSNYDQGFLADIIYPTIVNNVIVHLGIQKNINGAPSNGYFPDGGTLLPEYPLITEYIPNIDIEVCHLENDFHCIHCKRNHSFFIGEMFNNLNSKVKQYIEKQLI